MSAYLGVGNRQLFVPSSVISFGHNSANNSYFLGGVLLNRDKDIWDLGVAYNIRL